MKTKQLIKKTINSGTSQQVIFCQSCGKNNLESILFLGYLPPVNKLNPIGSFPKEETSYPAQLLYCNSCHLAQLGLIVDPVILFPKEYPYTSNTTKVLRDNFADLASEINDTFTFPKKSLVIDIGSNDGTLLTNFKKYYTVLGITPEDIGNEAIKKGIPTIFSYFDKKIATKIITSYGKAQIITATNVFAHMEHIHEVIESIAKIIKEDGIFVSESHYLLPLLKKVQYDTIYHEHMRYYSLISIKNLLEFHGFEIFKTKEIPSHGGSIRVYAAKKGHYPLDQSVTIQLKKEKQFVTNTKSLYDFAKKTTLSKLALYNLLYRIKRKGKIIYGISAPSRASTLINYTGINEDIIDCVLEVKGSYKIGKYIPGTLIPILEETKLYIDQPDYVIIFSWHIAEELIPKLKSNGYNGKFIIPLPIPYITS